MATEWRPLTPPDNTVFSAPRTITFTFSDAGGFRPVAGEVTMNGVKVATFSGAAVTNQYSTEYILDLDLVAYLDPISGIVEAFDYRITPVHGWPVGDNVLHIEGDILTTTYQQDRNFTVLETDYEGFWNETSKDRLIQQFKERILLEGWLDAYTNQVQDLEKTLEDYLYMRQLSNATGTQLGWLGEILNVSREGLLDDHVRDSASATTQTYRDEILLTRDILTSEGTESDIVDVFLRLLKAPDTTEVEWDEAFPKSVVLRARDYISPGTDVNQDALLDRLQQAAPAGTDLEYVYSLTQASDDDIFHFSTVADTTQTSATYGTENGDLCGAAKTAADREAS